MIPAGLKAGSMAYKNAKNSIQRQKKELDQVLIKPL